MDDTIEALRNAGWSPRALKRRLLLFEQRTRGVPMGDILVQFNPQVSERQMYLDWAAVKAVLNVAAAPSIASCRARIDGRFERIYMLAMAEIARAIRNKEPIPRGMLAEARMVEIARAELYGAIDRRGMALIQLPASSRVNELTGKSDEQLREMIANEISAVARLDPQLAAVVNREGNGSHS